MSKKKLNPNASLLEKIASAIFQTLISLKFAVIIMIILTAAMTAATFLESIYDTPTGKYWVYGSM